jgi:tRNA U34 5-carboxymethylaminomethyl modifying GTPase MnmE/TrmE
LLSRRVSPPRKISHRSKEFPRPATGIPALSTKTLNERADRARHSLCPANDQRPTTNDHTPNDHMPCHLVHERATAVRRTLTLRARPLRIVLVGQPNVGKSVVFGRLTGRYATVSNYPGTTVAITTGRALVGAEVCDVIDAMSEDERITRDVVAGPKADLIVQVADARNSGAR